MAVIGKIRNRLGGLLVVLVGGALVLFVVGDFLDSRQGYTSGSRSIGTIDGEDVDLAAFDRRVNDEVESLREDFSQPMDNNAQEQIRTQVWNEVVRERVLKSQLAAAGFGEEISQEEYDDIRFGGNIQNEFKGQPQFQGPDGNPDPKKIHEWFLMIEERSPSNNERKGYAEIYRTRLSDGRLYAKYNDLTSTSRRTSRPLSTSWPRPTTPSPIRSTM
jgi:peptidyl-prolyl cis-trans isomerase D